MMLEDHEAKRASNILVWSSVISTAHAGRQSIFAMSCLVLCVSHLGSEVHEASRISRRIAAQARAPAGYFRTALALD